LLYRDHVQFDTREDQQSSVHGIDVEEYFFTPTMTKYRQEQSKEVNFMYKKAYRSAAVIHTLIIEPQTFADTFTTTNYTSSHILFIILVKK
jgi:hypothetical protein